MQTNIPEVSVGILAKMPDLQSMPDVTPSFERPGYAIAALGIAVVGTAVTKFRAGQVNERAAEQGVMLDSNNDDGRAHEYRLANPDMAEDARRLFRKTKLAGVAAGLLFTLALSSEALDRAQPYDETNTALVDSVAIVIEAGADSNAGDVLEDSDDKPDRDVSRVQAGYNSAQRLANNVSENVGEDVEVNIVFAGAKPELIGSIRGTDGSEKAAKAADKYLDDLSNASDPNLAVALSVAAATEPGYIVVQTTDGSQATRDALATLDPKRSTIVSAGQEGTTYQNITSEATADFTAFNEDTEIARSTSDLAEIFDDVTTGKILKTENRPNNIFETVRNSAVATGFVLFVGAAAMPFRGIRRGRHNKGDK